MLTAKRNTLTKNDKGHPELKSHGFYFCFFFVPFVAFVATPLKP